MPLIECAPSAMTSIEGEVGEASGDLAPSSPRRAVASEESTGVRFRGGAIPAKSTEEVLKELQQLWSREREIRERNPERPVVKPPVVPVKPERGGAGFGVRHLFLAMALLSIALVTLLAVFHSSATPPVDAAASQGKQVTYGSVIKLQHERTKFRLHSHEVPYGSGSGQQSVTAFPGVEDGNSHWIVHPVADEEHEQGDVIPNGSTVRLQHVRTRKWLHSHHHQSPISGNLEVSAFGGEEQSDTGDYWKLEIEGKGAVWMQDQKVRLRHVDTNGYLHSHDKKYSRIVQGQQEVCGVAKKNADNVWTAAEGIYFLPKSKLV